MVNKLLRDSKKLLFSEQSSVLSAATLIMVMVVISKILGFIRQRVLFTFFSPAETDLFLAAFELPDILFEVFVFGTLSAAFIPVFTTYISKKKESEAWHVASASLNILLVVYSLLAILVFVFADKAYGVLTGGFVKEMVGISGGFSVDDISTVVSLTRILLVGQFFFVISSFMTGILESYKRFLFPAIAPLVYNVGIIAGTIFLSPHYGLNGPVVGALIGAICHLLVQAPVAYHLGFRFSFVWDTKHPGVRNLFILAAPRILELSVFQIKRFVWLFLGSLTVGGFTYLKSADLLQTLPVSVFGISLAKAALPTLSRQAENDMAGFKRTFFTTLNQILFLVIPISIFLVVLRIPVVRLIFGAEQFDWSATISTSYTLSAFALGTSAYAASLLVSRAFYALHDTKTPVTVSIVSVIINAILGFVLVLYLETGTWGIALAYSISGIIQFVALMALLLQKLNANRNRFLIPLSKMVAASLVAGFIMRLVLRLFDRSVWVKQLSFISSQDVIQSINYERFVLDTRYSGNLLILTIMVCLMGSTVYVSLLILMRSQEVWAFFGFAKRIFKRNIAPIPNLESEQVSPPPIDSGN